MKCPSSTLTFEENSSHGSLNTQTFWHFIIQLFNNVRTETMASFTLKGQLIFNCFTNLSIVKEVVCFNAKNMSLFSEDGVCKDVSVSINEVEARMVFVDHRHGEMSVRFIQLSAIDET